MSVYETPRAETKHPAPAALRRGVRVSKEVSDPVVSILTDESRFWSVH